MIECRGALTVVPLITIAALLIVLVVIRAKRAKIQVFFFPSGEVSPLTLTLRAYDDLEAEQRLRVSALGQFSDPDARDDEESEQ